jgi:hypothetical protein
LLVLSFTGFDPQRKFLSSQKLQEEAADFCWLLLLYPVSRTINQISATPSSTCSGLHSLKGTRTLVDTPIAPASNEASGHIDRTARKRLQLGSVFAASAAIPLQATLKPRPSKFASVYVQFVLSKPLARGDLLSRWQFFCDRLSHPLPEIHDVVGRHFRQLAGSERG